VERWTRRDFIKGTARAAAGAAAAGTACGAGPSGPAPGEAEGTEGALVIPLDGTWLFRTDPEKKGEAQGWSGREAPRDGWEQVTVPSTWQVAEKTVEYMGAAWYRRAFDAPEDWKGKVVRIEFEAVFHTAEVFVNGEPAGRHVGKGYTAFTLDVTPLLEFGALNWIAVRADNSFAPDMLPRNNSYDWTPDGGLTRPVRLIVTSPLYLEYVWVEAVPDMSGATADIAVTAVVRNAMDRPAAIDIGFRVIDETTGLEAPGGSGRLKAEVPARTSREIALPRAALERPALWHFDQPRLYRLAAGVRYRDRTVHELATTFGVRRIEVRGTEILLNGEPVRLAGVERMAGSHPDLGQAEPGSWIAHDHDDLKELNCVFTRVHWQQDRRVMDECDRKGILIQVEVPTWGPGTFQGLEGDLLEDITRNGLEQLREMIALERNHPCVFSWGLCNEVDGQNPVAREFVRKMLREAKRLDPGRLCSYASNSLQSTPEQDVAGDLDFIAWNEYYETWMAGDVDAMRRNLEAIHRAFPDKPVVISEYGYCACTSDRPENDGRRAEILETHNAAFRDFPWVAGLIFFDYNDYRTHMGDKGTGVLRQRVHGVVDVFGARKPSFGVLRRESSPVNSLEVRPDGRTVAVTVRTRRDLPSYTLRGYRLRWTVFGHGHIPLARREASLPDLRPGEVFEFRFDREDRGGPAEAARILIEVVRPTGFSAASAEAALAR